MAKPKITDLVKQKSKELKQTNCKSLITNFILLELIASLKYYKNHVYNRNN